MENNITRMEITEYRNDNSIGNSRNEQNTVIHVVTIFSRRSRRRTARAYGEPITPETLNRIASEYCNIAVSFEE